MTPQEVALVQASFAKVAPISDKAGELFYGRLFEIAPQVRPMFPDDITEQRKKLMKMLGMVVNNLHQVEKIVPAAQDLGRRHVAYGAKPEHYPVVGEALLWTLETGLGPEFTPEVKSAWVAAYGTLSSVMIAAADKVEVKAAGKPKTPPKPGLFGWLFGGAKKKSA